MASWVFCNRCFQPPQATSCFSLTNCGHVYCDVCLRKGKRDECLICKVACRTILLSKHTDSDIQALFMGIDSLCRKYAKETSQISEFQEKHRRRLLAFYGEKISQLEESLRKSTLRVEQLQRVRSSQQAVFSTVKTPASTPSARPNGPLFQSRDSSASERVESMEVDLTPSPRRKPEVTAGPPRISLLSPPRDGRMGSIAHRPQHLGLMPRCASEPQALRIPALQMPCEWPRQSPAPAAGRGAAPRQPISISGLMQRHQGLPALGDLCTSESRLLPSGCPRGAHA
ncbi:probable E3 SUMO-protein ligase RNF212 isoform X1 [Cervus elaphus]|uniref:probable E3 SUMO-protein ligase RNF212 isoform X1 n=1 Tax=Cervus canadensis TaxID=1574408 RepID=UPI001C9E26AA|nr:probable E3 SUMO-protein ligase RNF212 isoform X1 [Cervus canadensis]XP_043342692.1 probable E3 SUMO-protein ligase RNF212 [Cervus canadensis]XP_043761865.1 probable E3 SUMO-protein ligase RNF212 isoform X1 [Cervus elaphus]